MKYWCENCKSVLDEDDLELYQEPSEAWGHTVYEDWWLCPHCHEQPVEYDNQDRTCEECVHFGKEECCYGECRKDGKVCGDFEEGD